ncbi:hypothetical protein IT774_05035 [Salinimonas marina]|uniref:Mor transcription activator domain-containing protein n=1 Tax=Salinimonas marina TaxID=2785918 RepID=A0A7S9DYY7_9ALTE|nr:Mor transcription activator family protein [Salinimonas marina]QPG06539.1 hypothetical protein IT774_05035 [Salinimonas marina]
MSYEKYTPSSVWEKDIAEVIGIDGLVALEKAFGARYLYITLQQPKPDLVAAIGQEAATKLTRIFGGEDIYVPRVVLRQIRNDHLEEGKNAGKTVHELAAQFSIKSKRIITILKERGEHARTKRRPEQ